MKNLFLDTNVVIDYIANREPFADSALKIFDLAFKNKIKIFISAITYNNIYYILKKFYTHKETLLLLDNLMENTEVIDVTKTILEKSIKSNFNDFEDAIQYYSATSINKIEVIITRNTKDFKKSDLPVLTTNEAIKIIIQGK
jgi:predicted nucleic acid-binding protein